MGVYKKQLISRHIERQKLEIGSLCECQLMKVLATGAKSQTLASWLDCTLILKCLHNTAKSLVYSQVIHNLIIFMQSAPIGSDSKIDIIINSTVAIQVASFRT